MQTNELFNFFNDTAYFASTAASELSGTVYARLIETKEKKVYDSAASSTGYLTDNPSSWANTMITATAQYGAYALTLPSTAPNGVYLFLLYASASPSSADAPARAGFCVIEGGQFKLFTTI